MENWDRYLWQVHLFGGPILTSSRADGRFQVHFRSAKVANLLSYLALHLGEPCPREAIMEALWPEEQNFETLANRLRVTLASLRKQLEPPGYSFGSVLDTSILGCVRLRPEVVWCDLIAFNQAHASQDFSLAASFLTGPLLPGFYDEWVSLEQIRIELIREELKPIKVASPTNSLPIAPVSRIHRLPLAIARFIGRKSEMELLGNLLGRHRLVTVTGPPGVGKTRIAIEACELSSCPTIFIPLVNCTDRDSLAETVSRHISATSQTNPDPFQQAMECIGNLGTCRLLLDNAEHIVDEVSELVSASLTSSPSISFAVSSRHALELEGEQVLRIDPFGIPPDGAYKKPELLEASPSVALFLDRIQQSRPDFVIKDSNADLVVSICRKLEGLPLAIELAAAQISTNSLQEIHDQLESSLFDLKSRRRSLNSRHRSLRATIESSFDGLQVETRQALSRLSIFWGGYTRAAARVITNNANIDELLEELVARSLVMLHNEEGPSRFSSLELIRQFAQEHLSRSEMESLQELHRDYFFKIASGVREDDVRTLLELDYEGLNLEAAFARPKLQGLDFWKANRGAILHAFIRGEHRTGLRWIREFKDALHQCPDDDVARDWMYAALQILPDIGLFGEAETLLNNLEFRATKGNDEVGKVIGLISRGLKEARLGNSAAALDLHREALSMARGLGNPSLLESALSHLSGTFHEVARTQHTLSQAREILLIDSAAHAKELLEIVGPWSRRLPLAHLLVGVAAYYQSQDELAEHHLSEAIQTAERFRIRSVVMYASYFESELANRQTDTVRAEMKRARFHDLQSQIGLFIRSTSTW